ncbi:MAG: hypothetical protein E5X33_20075 [Mesorhizobium sp.]|nr:MAG: hypothetical protein E5X33_20075 [Mesorhizobium sp.]
MMWVSGPFPYVADLLAQAFLAADYRLVLDVVSLNKASVTAYDSWENRDLFNAVVAAEDIRFESHRGFDIRAMVRALWCTLSKGHLQGASTIEQQLVRVIRQRFEISLRRKVGEVLLATMLSKYFDKRTLLEVYLELAYFGWRGNGLRQICERLELQPNQLSSDDAILLAALLKVPMPRHRSQTYNARLGRRISRIRKLLQQA